MRIAKYVPIITFLFILTACISTQVRDFTDPEYKTFTAKTLLVITPSQEFDDIFLNVIHDKNINVSAKRFSDVFLPTRKYSTEEMTKIIKNKGYDAVIIITLAGEESSSQVVAYMTNSSAQAYSTGYNTAYASGSGLTIPLTAHKRSTTSKAELYDPINKRKIWVADLSTKASGSLYVQNDDTMESISEEVVNTLLNKKHLIANAKR